MLLSIAYLLLFVAVLTGFIKTYQCVKTLKPKWLSRLQWIAVPVFICTIGISIYSLRTLTLDDYFSFLFGIGPFLALIELICLGFLTLIGILGIPVSGIFFGILILHWIFPKANVSYIIRHRKNNLSTTLKFKRFFIYLVSSGFILMLLCTFLHAWYQNFGVAMTVLPLPFPILLIVLEISFIFGIMQWNTLKGSGINLVLFTMIMVIISADYGAGVMGEDQYLYNKFIDLRFQYDYPALIHLVMPDATKILNRRPLSDVLNNANIQSGQTNTGTKYIRIITGYRGMASNATAWGYVYMENNDLKNIPDILHWRKITNNWYWAIFDY